MASHLRKNATITNAAETIKLLYAILKQCELKNIDWQDVANELAIPQGHAARMRYTRFKQHQDGDLPTRKGARANTGGEEPKERRKKKESVRKRVKKEEGASAEGGGEVGQEIKVQVKKEEVGTETENDNGSGIDVGVGAGVGSGVIADYQEEGDGEMDALGEVDYGYHIPGVGGMGMSGYDGTVSGAFGMVPVKSEVQVKLEPDVGGYGAEFGMPVWPVDLYPGEFGSFGL